MTEFLQKCTMLIILLCLSRANVDALRVMIGDEEYDDSETSGITDWNIPLSYYDKDVNGILTLVNHKDETTSSLNKRLEMRALCFRSNTKKSLMGANRVSGYQDENATNISATKSNLRRAGGNWFFDRFPTWGEEPNQNWWYAFLQQALSNVFGRLFDRWANKVTKNGASKNCFDEIATWIQNDFKVSFQMRANGNCGTNAQSQTIYDALYDIISFWKYKNYRKGCAVMDHGGGGRYEITMSASSQPAYEVVCSNKKFFACKANEDGYPSCEQTHSIHDEI
ncbi:hypothetical protein E3Q18_00584 [Wallemia mellicola]|nr:hypothetical protein E3Q18_00584 [Wallemia mellicola]